MYSVHVLYYTIVRIRPKAPDSTHQLSVYQPLRFRFPDKLLTELQKQYPSVGGAGGFHTS